MNKANLQEGDIIFIANPNLLDHRVTQGTGSKASHVGIVLNDGHSDWVVAESAVPISRYSTLEAFIRRSEKG